MEENLLKHLKKMQCFISRKKNISCIDPVGMIIEETAQKFNIEPYLYNSDSPATLHNLQVCIPKAWEEFVRLKNPGG